MQESSYWDKLRRGRISRRRLLGGALGVGAGAAGLALVACGGEGDEAAAPEETPEATPGAGALVPVGTRGGTHRYFSFESLPLDTLDPHQTQFGPIYGMHSAVFSKVLSYDDDVQQIMSPDLADGMPEQPDDLTYVIKIRPNVFFHDTASIRSNFPDVAGRQLTAEDVKYSIERQLNEASPKSLLYYRKGQWQTIDTIEVVDDLTLRITTKAPIAPFLHYLADRNAYIVAKEVVDGNDELNEGSRMVGTGPFILEKLESLVETIVTRNPNWFAKDDNPGGVGLDRPFLDGYISLWTPQSDSVEETAFKSKQIDDGDFDDRSNYFRIADEIPGTVFQQTLGNSGAMNTRFLIDERSPFQDFRLRRAIHLAFDRQLVGEQVFQEHQRPNGPVNWPQVLWAIPQSELIQKPGYRRVPAEREEDLREARQLWDSAGGNEVVGTLKIIFSGVPDYIPNIALPSIQRQLEEVFGARVETEVDATGYTVLAECLIRNTVGEKEGTCDFTYGFDNGWIDLDDWLYPYFHTTGSKNSFKLSDPKVDELLDKQRGEFNFEERQKIGLELQHYLLDNVNAMLHYFTDVQMNIQWPFVKNKREGYPGTWFGNNQWYANVWLDQNDPTWQGRPA